MTDQSNTPIEPGQSAEKAQPQDADSQERSAESQVAAQTDAETSQLGPSAREAWGDVVISLGDLGGAISAWAKAATDTPENRQHLEEVRSVVNDMARQASEAFSAVAESDFGRQVAEGATQVGSAIGSTAQGIGQAAAPHVASAFAGLADAFGRAAEKVGEAATPRDAEPSSRPAPEPPPVASPEDSTAEPYPPEEPPDDERE
jgi:hypothetical protein